jgi:hypothetical protein
MSRRAARQHGSPVSRKWIDAGALALMFGAGVLGFGPTFGGDARYLAAGFGGVLLGLGIAWLGTELRWGGWTVAGAVLAAYLLLGSVFAAPLESFAGFLPTLESLRVLTLGVVFAWKNILTVADPVGVRSGMLVVPFLGALVCAAAAGSLAWRVRNPSWGLVPTALFFVAAIAFGTHHSSVPELRGLLLVAAGTSWLAYRREADRKQVGTAVAPDVVGTGPGTPRRRRLALAAGVMATATALTLAVSPLLAGGEDRTVLRDAVEPPIDLFDYPSPLTSFRKYVKDNSDEVLLTVEGLPKGQRVRLAAMDAYNGVVYNVNPQEAGNFSRVGDAQQLGGVPSGGAAARLRFSIADYNGVWLPTAGTLHGVELAGPRADTLGRGLYYNEDAMTALSTAGVRAGDNYVALVQFPQIPSDARLAEEGFADVRLPRVLSDPPIIAAKASDYAGEAEGPVARVRRLEQTLRSQGYFSNGKEDQPPSLPGHGAARMLALLDAEQMVGDDEQYAVAMALMARKLDIPARVVMGFYPDWQKVKDPAAPIDIRGGDVHAWVEIAFRDTGWVPFDPTPPEDNEPVPPQEQPRSKPKPQVLQPPPPPQEPAELPPDTAPEPQDAEDRRETFWDVWGPLLTAVAVALIPVAVLLLPLLLIALLKARRRKKRASAGRPAQRVGGGWSELVSFATDLGVRVNPRATRRESAAGLGEAFPAGAQATTLLAQRADAGIFGPNEPTEDQVREYWGQVEKSLGQMGGSVGFWKRQRARYSLRSLLMERRRRASAGNMTAVKGTRRWHS